MAKKSANDLLAYVGFIAIIVMVVLIILRVMGKI